MRPPPFGCRSLSWPADGARCGDTRRRRIVPEWHSCHPSDPSSALERRACSFQGSRPSLKSCCPLGAPEGRGWAEGDRGMGDGALGVGLGVGRREVDSRSSIVDRERRGVGRWTLLLGLWGCRSAGHGWSGLGSSPSRIASFAPGRKILESNSGRDPCLFIERLWVVCPRLFFVYAQLLMPFRGSRSGPSTRGSIPNADYPIRSCGYGLSFGGVCSPTLHPPSRAGKWSARGCGGTRGRRGR
jgi:hypothetical protein